jgi:hypothetical protein
VGSVGDPYYPLIQRLLPVCLYLSLELVLRLLYAILIFVAPWYPAILLRRSLVVLRGVFSIHYVRGDEWKAEGRSDSKQKA